VADCCHLPFYQLAFLVLYLQDPSDTAVGGFLVFTTVLCLVFYMVNARHHLYLDNKILIYKTARSTREIHWNDLIRSEISWTVEGLHTASVNWNFYTGNASLEIRLGFFSRSDMQVLAQQLIDQAPQAVLSNKIYQFAEGKFPWYLF
jgi:hypothetical protein